MVKKNNLSKIAEGVFVLTLSATMATVNAQQVRHKMTTEIPASITTPDVVETSLGTVRLFDGFPDSKTVQKIYDNLDFQRGVQAFLTELPSAYASKQSCEGFLVGDCLRSTDPIAATDGPAVPRFQQPENGPYLQSRRIDRYLFRPRTTSRQRE